MDKAFAGQGWQTVDGRNPAIVSKPWSRLVLILLCLTGLITPYLCFAVAPIAFALSDQDDGFLLAGVGGAHLFLATALTGVI
jgi:hypothetical protein